MSILKICFNKLTSYFYTNLILLMEIGEKIRLLPERKGFKQEFMADELGMTINGYGKIERGEVDVSWGKLDQISKALGLDGATDLVKIDERQFFEIHNNHITNQTNNGLVIQEMSNHERQLYEKRIESMENHLRTLEEVIALLKKETSANANKA